MDHQPESLVAVEAFCSAQVRRLKAEGWNLERRVARRIRRRLEPQWKVEIRGHPAGNPGRRRPAQP